MKYLILYLSLLILCRCSSINFAEYFDELQIFEGGGFTGFYSGYIITKSGKVLNCKGKGICEKSEVVRDLSKSEIENIIQIIETNNLWNLEHQHPYNISRYIIIKKGEKSKVLIWNPHSDETIAKKLNTIYDNILEIVEQNEVQK